MIMEKTIRILLFLSLLFLPFTSYAQHQKVRFSGEKITLKAAFNLIEKQTGLSVAYDSQAIDSQKTISSVSGEIPVDQLMTLLLDETDCTYTISGSRIIITQKKEDAPKISLQKISGTITTNNGEPIIGASVVIKGTASGTITDVSGRFSLTVSPDAVLTVSYVGYKTQEIKVNGRTSLRVVLQEDKMLLDEVIVVGYGLQKKSVVTAAISSVKTEDLEKISATRIDNVLKGMVSGVNITQSSGQPGAGSKVRIRGIGTINNSEPLYIVDGMPIGGGIDYLNPQDISSVEILKDAASAAIYGSRAANGVILVTTKLGDKTRPKLEYSTSFGWQNPWKKRDVLNGREYAILMNEIQLNDGKSPIYLNPESFGKGIDWQDKVFNYNAPIVEHQVNFSGGSAKSSYYLSLSYLYHEGIVGGNLNRSNYERYTTRFNNQYIVWDIDERMLLRSLKVGTNISYSRILSRTIGTNSERGTPLGSALMMSPLMDVYAENPDEVFEQFPNAVTDFKGVPFTIVDSQFGITNPVARLHLPGDKDNSDKYVGNFWGEVELYKNLKFKSSFGVDMGFWGNDGYTMPYYLGAFHYTDQSSVWSSMYRSFTWLVENLFTYNLNIDDHQFNFLLGQSAQSSNSQGVGGISYDIRNPKQPYIDATDKASNERGAWGSPSAYHRLASYFGKIGYNYRERYIVEATLRRDGSSNFGRKNRWANFPSLSVGWTITNEEFMEDKMDFLSSAKLRASWGKNGNQSIGEFGYTSTIVGNINYILGMEGQNVIAPGSTPTAYSNPYLRWEESEQTNIGLDTYFFNGALSFTFDWFNKRTNGMLMTMALPQYIGNSRPIGNVGDMRNQGVEFDLKYRFRFNQFKFNVGANASYIKNTLIKLGNETGWANYDTALGGVGTFTRAENGQPFPFFYGMKTDGIFQTEQEVQDYVNKDGELLQPNAKPGDVRFVDTNKDGVVDEYDRVNIGNGMPPWTLGLNADMEWKGFDLSTVFHVSLGNDVFDVSRRTDLPPVNLPSYMLKRWTGPGSSNRIPRLSNDLSNNNWRSSDLYVHDGSFLRLRNLQIGYSIPENLVKKVLLQKVRFYVNAENLLTITRYHGFDPEISSGGTSLGVDRGIYPQPRVFSFGANIIL